MEDAYSQKVMEHFMRPRNVGEIPDASGVGTVGNPICGDIMKLFIKVEKGIVTDAKFKTFGCGAAIATSSMVTELVKGRSVDEAARISNHAVAEALDGLPAKKMHCSLLAEDALKAALRDYFTRSGDQAGLNMLESSTPRGATGGHPSGGGHARGHGAGGA